jgi:crotonobetainyl-CoA:carnitine CoA-transferase CaiB-like acyl-CoA transferase
LAAGVVYSPDEALTDPHVVARGFLVEVDHPELGRSIAYPGAPYRFSHTPWEIRRRPPLLGEHQTLLDEL